MKLFDLASKCKGSISLFLTIILLPTLTFTGLIVDSANLALSKSVVENAGELTTNAALANYDTVLKDVYGLFAISQSGETSMDAEGYFSNTLEAKKMLDSVQTAVSGLNQNIKDFLGVEDTSKTINNNFLRVDYEDFELKGVAGSSLRNSQVLKNQIVEFMKYRGPAEIVMDLFASTAAFQAADSKIDVTTAKTDVDAAKADLGTVCRTLYQALVTYDSRVDNFKKAEKEWNSNVAELNKKLERVNELEITLLINSPDVSKVTFVEQKNGTGIQKYKMSTAHATIKSNKWVELQNYYQEYLSKCQKYAEELAPKLRNFDNLESLDKRETMSKYLDFYNDLANLMYSYQELCTLVGKKTEKFGLTQEAGESDKTFKARIESTRETCEKWLRETVYNEMTDIYIFSSNYKNVVEEFKNKIKTAKDEAESLYSEVYTAFENYYSSVESLTGADLTSGDPLSKHFLITKGKEKQKKKNNYDYLLYLCSRVKEELAKVKTENAELKNEADEYGETTAKDEYYQEMQSEVALNNATFKAEDLDELISQIKANKSYMLNGVAKRYQDYKLYEKVFRKMDSLSDLEKQMKKVEKSITGGFDPTKYSQYFKTYFPKKFYSQKDNFTEASYLKKFKEAGVNAGETTVNVASFYVYLETMYGCYKETETDDADNATKNISSINDNARDEVSGEVTGVNEYEFEVFDSLTTEGGELDVNEIEKIDSGSSSAILRQFSSIGRTVKGMFGMFKNGWSGLADILLVDEYIFQNFSYATMSKELEKSSDSDKQYMTTTNVAINQNNNKIYGCEIEYILEGYRGTPDKEKSFLWFNWTKEGDGPEQNVKIVKTNIFMIRFLMNTIFALTSSNLRRDCEAPAQSLSAATMGAVPAEVWKVILEIVLALCESSYDLKHLMDGEEMPIYKSDDNWVFQFSTLADTLTQEAGNYVSEKLNDIMGKVIDTGESIVGKVVSGVFDEVVGSVDTVLTKVSDELTGVVNEQIQNLVGSMGEVIKNNVKETYLNILTEGLTFNRESFRNKLYEQLETYYGEESELDPEIKKILAEYGNTMVDKIVDSSVGDKLDEISDKLKYTVDLGDNFETDIVIDGNLLAELLNGTSTILEGYVDSIAGELKDKAMGYVNEYRDKAEQLVSDEVSKYGDKAKEWSQEQSEKLGESINKWMNDTFGDYTSTASGSTGSSSSGVSEQSSFVSKLINFSYKDYLRLFVLFGLGSKEQSDIIGRIADVIEMNVEDGLMDYYAEEDTVPYHPAGSSFSMSKAYTYVELSTTVKVKPLLLSQPVFNDGLPISFWNYTYTNAQGY